MRNKRRSSLQFQLPSIVQFTRGVLCLILTTQAFFSTSPGYSAEQSAADSTGMGLPADGKVHEHESVTTNRKVPAQTIAQASQGIAEVDNRSNDADIASSYVAVTKKLMLAAIQLERFSLTYRLENGKRPRLRRLRYFLAQEAGAGGGLAFELIALEQFKRGKTAPLSIDTNSLHKAFTTLTATSIVAGSGSAFELANNTFRAIQLKQKGLDSKSARKYVVSNLKEIDDLLVQREAIATQLPGAARERAVVEGKVLHELRNAFASEFTEFQTNVRTFNTIQNTFFLLNAGYNTISAVAAGIGHKAVTEPKLNGRVNILFTVSGAMATVTPPISSAVGAVVRHSTRRSLEKELGTSIKFDPSNLKAQCSILEKLVAADPDGSGSVITSLPASQRLGIYTQSESLFRKQLESEIRTSQKLSQVALESSLLGPPIGGLLMTQGILGTRGFYKYKFQPRKQLQLNYDGAIIGTIGTSMAVAGNASALLGAWLYEQNLKGKNRLPSQLIESRLNHLTELEKTVSAL